MSIQTVEISLPESIIKVIEIRQGPAGPGGGGNNITSATTSDGTANLYLDSIRFEATNGGPTQLGEMAWESTDGSIDAMLESGVIVAMGEDLVIRVRNTTASPITKGTALAYDGTSGASGRIEVKPWVGANIPTAKLFLGFAACDMPANSNGYSQWFGKLAEINTSGGAQTWLDEQIIYAVPGASATLTNVAPTSGEYVAAAVVINAGSGTSGILFVRPTFESITSLISLGAGTTGSELFGAADAAAARTTLELAATNAPTFGGLDLLTATTTTLNVYNSLSGANFERLSFRWASNIARIGTAKGGTGTARDLVLETDGTERVRVSASGNVGIGTTAPNYPIHIERNANNFTSAVILVKNLSTAGGATAEMRVENALGYSSRFFKLSSGYTTYKTLTANGMGFYNDTNAGNISILNDFASGNITLTAGGSSTAHLTVASTGIITVSNTTASTTTTTGALVVSGGVGVAGNINAGGSIAATGTVKTGGYTFATLPTPTQGMRTFITDGAALPIYMANAAGGSNVVTPVFYNGTNWINA
jgi:hypothetical protein